jgi:YaaC-like Protein
VTRTHGGPRIAIPRVNQSDHLAPLMLWWSTLYALSTFARYESDRWLDALNVDESELAVPLEELLDVAMSAIPALVLMELLEGHQQTHSASELEGG